MTVQFVRGALRAGLFVAVAAFALWGRPSAGAGTPGIPRQPVPINCAEAIIEPFWSEGVSGFSKWAVDDGAAHGLYIHQHWFTVDFEWARRPEQGPALRMWREFDVDCSRYNRLILRMAGPRDAVMHIEVDTDTGVRTVSSEPFAGEETEIFLDLDGARVIRRITLALEAHHRKPYRDLVAELARSVGATFQFPTDESEIVPGLASGYWRDGAAAADRAKALVALGVIQIYQGANREAGFSLAEGLAGCRILGDALQTVLALIGLSALAIMQRDYGHGAALLEEALAVTQDVADRRLAQALAGRISINLAVAPRAQGHYALAEEHLEAALRLLREVGSREGIILALGDLGNIARDQGDANRALTLYIEALELGRSHPGTRYVTEVIEATGSVGHRALRGDMERVEYPPPAAPGVRSGRCGRGLP